MAKQTLNIQVVVGTPYVVPTGKYIIATITQPIGGTGTNWLVNGSVMVALVQGGIFHPVTAGSGDAITVTGTPGAYISVIGFLYDD